MKILGDTIVCKIMHSQSCFSCGRHLATAETIKATEKIVLKNGGSIRKEDDFYRAYCASHVPPNSSGLADELLPGIALPEWILRNTANR